MVAQPQYNSTGADDMEPLPDSAPEPQTSEPDDSPLPSEYSGNLDHGKSAKGANGTLKALGAGSSYRGKIQLHDTAELKKLLDKAKESYQDSLAALHNPDLTDEERQTSAQRANDAYLEYQRIDRVVTNCLITKKLGDLFGC